MLSMQEMSDRLEIQDLLTAYCEAIDTRDFDALDDIFTEDAFIDYTATGGQKGDLAFAKAYLDRALEKFPGGQHMIGAPKLTIEGDTAHSKTILFNPMILEKDGQPHVFFVGAWYVDDLVRTPQGWRIKNRSEVSSYFYNFPEWFTPVE